MAPANRGRSGGKTPPIGRRFEKGKSGNPNGRPKVVGALKELARVHTAAALDTLVAGLKSESEVARLTAANSILDRGYGKASQHIELDAGDELTRRLAEALKRNGGG